MVAEPSGFSRRQPGAGWGFIFLLIHLVRRHALPAMTYVRRFGGAWCFSYSRYWDFLLGIA